MATDAGLHQLRCKAVTIRQGSTRMRTLSDRSALRNTREALELERRVKRAEEAARDTTLRTQLMEVRCSF